MNCYGKGAGLTVSFIESLIYGFVSGLAEFVPVSSHAHQALLLRLFGLANREPARDVFVHIAVLLALLTSCRAMFSHMLREQRLANSSRRRNRGDRRSAMDLRIVRTAAVPLLLGMLCYFVTKKVEQNFAVLAVTLVVNGVFLLIPEYTRHGNKDGRFMSGWDGILLGAAGAFSAIPGISRIGMMDFYTTLRGVDRKHALNWALLLSVPAVALMILFDLVNLFTLPLGTVTFLTFLFYLVSAVAAYFGGYCSILLVRYLSVHTGYAGFAYYSLGAAMFSFVLYLIV